MQKTAKVFRMAMDKHVCPFGLKSKYLLARNGFEVEDHRLLSRRETDAFKEKYQIQTTPQIFIDDVRVGGYDDLRVYLGKDKPKNERSDRSYTPIIALFATTFLMAMAAAFVATGSLLSALTAEWFIAFSMCVLAFLKLRDIESFSSMFLNYDVLAVRWVPYAYLYPFGEALAGMLMIAGLALWLAIPLALFLGTIGAVSVFRAVYVQKRDLKCACVGGESNVPLGFVSLTENILMVLMALWMVSKLM